MTDNYEYIMYNVKTEELQIIKKENVLDGLYFLEYKVPTYEQLNKNKDKEFEKIIKKHGSIKKYLKEFKINVSKIEDKIPLYDIKTENMYLILKFNVYDRVIHESYRFPEQALIDDIMYEEENLEKKIETEKITDILILRKLRKDKLIIEYINNFDLEILYLTYLKVFYEYSEYVGRENTICRKKSFIPQFKHMKPYYMRTEVINMCLNLGVNPQGDIRDLCKIVKQNEISAKILLDHQQHIIDYNYVGFVQYYTLQGSNIINRYMRNLVDYKYKNDYLENMIGNMWKLTLNSPEFDKNYTLYRFIYTDNHIRHLKINDIYVEQGFMSTTRDPFYKSDLYNFGFILIKINIPKNIKGIALCLELISHFPSEQEIIFPPYTHFKLINKDEKITYYNTDKNISSKIKTRYEFNWIKNEKINFLKKPILKEKPNNIDFLNTKIIETSIFDKKIEHFISNYVNIMDYILVSIGENKFTTFVERFDSTGVYNEFYALNVSNGLSFYSIYNGYLLFFIELGEIENIPRMAVNFSVKYSALDAEKILGDNNFIIFVSSIAYYFGISNVYIYSSYSSCEIHKKNKKVKLLQNGGFNNKNTKKNNYILNNRRKDYMINNIYDKIRYRTFTKGDQEFEIVSKNIDNIYYSDVNIYGGNYCIDIYNYLLFNKKRYEQSNIMHFELKPLFSYYDLDLLKKTPVETILKKDDNDECYQLYHKVFKINENNLSIANFYIWLIDKCYLLNDFILKVSRLLKKNNPFVNDVYLLDPTVFLYNRKLIKNYINIVNDIDITNYKKRLVYKPRIRME
jgi:hypothetical protein